MSRSNFHESDLRIYTCSMVHLAADSRWAETGMRSPFWRLYWNAQPGASIVLDGITYPIDPDKLILVAPHTDGLGDITVDVEHFYIHFNVGSPFDQIQNEIISFDMREAWQEIIDEIIRLGSGDSYKARFSLLTQNLLIQCLSSIPEEKVQNLQQIDSRIRKVLKEMERSGYAPCSNQELAGQLNMHTNAFTRLFREQVKESPQRFMNIKRIELACQLLHDKSLSIDDIAKHLGFCDRYHFSRVFKQIQDCAPGQFQKRMIR